MENKLAKEYPADSFFVIGAEDGESLEAQQMSIDWVDDVARRIRQAANQIEDEAKRLDRIAIADMITFNKDRILRAVTVVNKETKQINVLKLGTF